jgi:deaminated glutathione amidase
MPLAACVQIQGSSDVARNLDRTEALVRRAAAAGAVLVATPEATPFLGPHDRKIALAEPVDGPTHRRLAALAAELGIWLLVGSVAERCPDPAPGVPATRAWNTSLLFDDRGALQASYRKLHLFDVDLREAGGVRFAESDTTAPGEGLAVADTPLGRLGLSICYDLRFPEVYRGLVDRGATVLAVPSAFTAATGRDHWHVLLRARAIETQCFVIAPGQWGAHDDRGLRQSYGHSLIVDPWGTVLAECGDGEGWCIADLDPQRVLDVRGRMPVCAHRRLG